MTLSCPDGSSASKISKNVCHENCPNDRGCQLWRPESRKRLQLVNWYLSGTLKAIFSTELQKRKARHVKAAEKSRIQNGCWTWGPRIFATCVRMFRDALFDPFYLGNSLHYEVNTSKFYWQQQALLNSRKEKKTVQWLPAIGGSKMPATPFDSSWLSEWSRASNLNPCVSETVAAGKLILTR